MMVLMILKAIMMVKNLIGDIDNNDYDVGDDHDDDDNTDCDVLDW